ncbi:MAG: guanylate kinase [Gemmatimonadota bacterium]|nr:guanylate kinase [Gemmatimonadota bacterium]
MTPFLLVLSSPSGGGKTTIARRLLERRSDVGYSVSATTRAARRGEQHGKDYTFLTPEEFERRVQAQEFVEWASYNGQRYGTLKHEVERVFLTGRHVVLDIEVAGARQVRAQYPSAVLIFVLPPTGKVLAARLRARRTEPVEALQRRLAIARDELAAVPEYDYLVVNDDLERAIIEVSTIIDAEQHRVSRQVGLGERLTGLRDELADEVSRLRPEN